MARLWFDSARTSGLAISAILALLSAQARADTTFQKSYFLYTEPILLSDPGMHTSDVSAAATDAKGQIYVTASFDKSVRVWSAETGQLKRVIWVPAGPDVNGKLYTVAVSPDAGLIATAGQTWGDGQSSLFVFDSAKGTLQKRIPLGPRIINPEIGAINVISTTFSQDGRYLAAGLGVGGFRVFDREREWAEVFRDDRFDAPVYAMDFSDDGRLAVAGFDGLLKLYDAHFHELRIGWAPHNEAADNLRFSPDGLDLAISYRNKIAVDFVDGATLQRSEGSLSERELGGSGVSRVTWSKNTGELIIGTDHGLYRWSRLLGTSRYLSHSAYKRALISISSVPNGYIATTVDPRIFEIGTDNIEHWSVDRPFINFRPQSGTFAVSTDGNLIDFNLKAERLRFDVSNLALAPAPSDGATVPARNKTAAWVRNSSGGRDLETGHTALRLHPSDMLYSAADATDEDHFVIGSSFFLEAYSAKAKAEIWHRPVQTPVYATVVTRDNRLIVAAHADGTIRWYRTTDGRELLALYVLADHSWVIWTPEGFYASTPHAHGILKWLISRGADQAADTYLVARLHQLNRPDAIKLVLQNLDIAAAVGEADELASRQAVQQLTGADVATSSHLHVLSIGINEYGPLSLGLHTLYGRLDAELFMKTISESQANHISQPGDIYTDIQGQTLVDKAATRDGIRAALSKIEAELRDESPANNVVLIFFSGHGGRLRGGGYYLPTYDSVMINDDEIRDTAYSVDEMNQVIQRIAAHSRVTLFIDACHSGAVADSSSRLQPDPNGLRALAQANVNVFSSSSPSELSSEEPDWGHGALTKAVLDALTSTADLDHNGLISSTELATYLAEQMPILTKGKQTPTVELRYQSDFLAIGAP